MLSKKLILDKYKIIYLLKVPLNETKYTHLVCMYKCDTLNSYINKIIIYNNLHSEYIVVFINKLSHFFYN